MKQARVSHDKFPETFEELCAIHLPRTIRDKADYENTVEMVDRLAVLDRRSEGQEEYLETLTELIEAYDNEKFQIAAASDPRRAIRYLMSAHRLSASDIGRILGSRSLGSSILRGDRQISKENALKLAAHFKLNPGLFIGKYLLGAIMARRKSFKPAEVFRPGEYLRDELHARNWTQADFAKVIGRPMQAVIEIINGKKRITVETAKEFASAFGTSADLWRNLQNYYDLHTTPDPDPKIQARAMELARLQ